jgi:hypothetical protein
LQPAATRVPGCSHGFWPHEYNAPHAFRPAGLLSRHRATRVPLARPTRRGACALPLLARLGLVALPFPVVDGELVLQSRPAPPVACLRTSVPIGSNPFGR